MDGTCLPLQDWQHVASECVEDHFLQSVVLPCCLPPERALLRSQGGPLSGLPFVACPSSPHQRFASHLFSRFPWPSPHKLPNFRCLGTSWIRPGVRCRPCLSRSRCTCENQRVREGHGSSSSGSSRPTTPQGLPFFHGAQLTIDTTLVQPLHADGAPHPQCADVDGAALQRAHGRAKLVVVAAEVGGRWSNEAQTFLRLLVRANNRSLPEVLRVRARQAWLFRWSSLLACSAARAYASSLLELHGCLGADRPTSSTSSLFDECKMPRDSVKLRVVVRIASAWCVRYLISVDFFSISLQTNGPAPPRVEEASDHQTRDHPANPPERRRRSCRT